MDPVQYYQKIWQKNLRLHLEKVLLTLINYLQKEIVPHGYSFDH